MAGLLEIENVGKRFGGFVALDGINLSVAQGERVGLIGPNGSGKSTLVNCMCGTLMNETGTVRFAGDSVNGMAAHERTRRGQVHHTTSTSSAVAASASNTNHDKISIPSVAFILLLHHE